MRNLGLAGTIFIGFIAGVFFVIACGGGGSSVMAEITDITGIVTGLSNINTSIQGIDNSTDMTGVESELSTMTTTIGGLTLSTDVSGIVSELQNIDATLASIANNGGMPVRSKSFADSGSWQPHSGSESFVITDIVATNTSILGRTLSMDDGTTVLYTDFIPGNNYGQTETRHFNSGILFGAGTTINVELANSSSQSLFVSGYILN